MFTVDVKQQTIMQKQQQNIYIWILCKTNSLTLANPSLPSPPQKENIFFQTLILFEKKKKKRSRSLSTPPPLPFPAARFFFVRFGFFIKIHFPDSLYKKISLILTATLTEKIIHLCIILWILVPSDTVNDLILFGGHCDLYIMVQRFCLVSLTISNRKTSYRSLKQTAGSTSCPWTTILVSRLKALQKINFP